MQMSGNTVTLTSEQFTQLLQLANGRSDDPNFQLVEGSDKQIMSQKDRDLTSNDFNDRDSEGNTTFHHAAMLGKLIFL